MTINQKFVTVGQWEIFQCGDWARENQVGATRADALIERMQREDSPTLLGHTVKAILDAGVYGGCEVGFFHRIAERAAREV